MTGWRIVGALLLACLVTIAMPRPSDGQTGQTQMTLEQYLVMQERVDAFCNFYADQVNGSKPWPAGGEGVRIHGVGNGWYVYTPAEVQALMRHCRNVMELMRKSKQ